MKSIKFLALAALISGLTPVSAQNAGAPNPVGDALNEFGKVAGGWFLNQRCKFIVGSDLANYERDVGVINVALAKDLSNPELLVRVQLSAQKVANSEKFASCGDDVKQIVQLTSNHAKNWAAEIRTVQEK